MEVAPPHPLPPRRRACATRSANTKLVSCCSCLYSAYLLTRNSPNILLILPLFLYPTAPLLLCFQLILLLFHHPNNLLSFPFFLPPLPFSCSSSFLLFCILTSSLLPTASSLPPSSLSICTFFHRLFLQAKILDSLSIPSFVCYSSLLPLPSICCHFSSSSFTSAFSTSSFLPSVLHFIHVSPPLHFIPFYHYLFCLFYCISRFTNTIRELA